MLSLWLSNVFAATPDAFVVEVQPSSFDPNSPVDMTIKAVKGDGTVVKDYEGDVYIDIPSWLDSTDYVIPSDHLYTFVPQDQWVKLFSKGLIIKKAWTYTIQVSDIINDSIKWEKSVIVGTTVNPNLKTITIDSPMQSGTEKNEIINVFGSSVELPNSPFEIRLNNVPATQGMTDANWGINGYVTWVQKWSNTLQIKILDINNTVLWESSIVSFSYAPIADGVFNSIQILPSTKIKQWAKATFIISTNDSVSSVELLLSNGKSAPMDKDSAGTFKKEMMLDTAWNIEVSANLILNGQKKSYTGIANLIVDKNTSVGKVRLYWDPVNTQKLNITWEIIGEAAKYKILYWTGEADLIQSATVNTNEIALDNLLTWSTYFFKIVPLDTNGAEIGLASDIVQAKIWDLGPAWASCVVNGITVSDTTIGDKHYLTRSGVLNVSKYIIYRSDFETTDVSKMNKIAEVTDTKFEYPFNKDAKTEKYAYYLVQAICTDGNWVIIDNVKKVKTWPMENFLLFVVITLLIYCWYRLFLSSKIDW